MPSNFISIFHFPFSIFHFPFSIFHFPFSIFHFPFSIFHFPFSIFHFPFSIFHFPFHFHLFGSFRKESPSTATTNFTCATRRTAECKCLSLQRESLHLGRLEQPWASSKF